jgi:hypothetical protein
MSQITYYTKDEIINKISKPGNPTPENNYTGNNTDDEYVYNNEENKFYKKMPDGSYEVVSDFESLSKKLGWLTKNINNITVYYNSLDEEKENIKTELRKELELNIKNIINEYMPLHTMLWKIIYEGK